MMMMMMMMTTVVVVVLIVEIIITNILSISEIRDRSTVIRRRMTKMMMRGAPRGVHGNRKYRSTTYRKQK